MFNTITESPAFSRHQLLIVVHEDADLLAVHKPAGLVCHPTKHGPLSSLVSRARLYADSPMQLINRLDRETSGVVLFARTDSAAREIRKIWESRLVRKEYLAIVWGHPPHGETTIDAPLGKDLASRVAIKDCVRQDGAPSVTTFVVERHLQLRPRPGSLSPAPASLLRVFPGTGRKHQIRIHLAHIGHPIIGDKLYGGDEDLYLALVEDRLTAEQRARLVTSHHALHAGRVAFQWRGREWAFESAPEPWFLAFLGDGGDQPLNVDLSHGAAGN